MQYGEIKRLVKLVETSAIGSLEIKDGEFSIRIDKGIGVVPMVAPPPLPPPAAIPPVATGPAPAQAVEPASDFKPIRSPMVGTFYAAPGPDAEPYVKVGSEIHPGSVLCIIEAMKLMNEIEADVGGRVVKILVGDGQSVEFDQPLFLIEPLA